MPRLPLRALGLQVACSAAVSASLPARAQVPLKAGGDAETLRSACRADYDPALQRRSTGGGRILACLQDHANELNSDAAGDRECSVEERRARHAEMTMSALSQEQRFGPRQPTVRFAIHCKLGLFEPILQRNHAAGTARPRASDRSGRI
jgi:hypothetical protein